MTGTDKNITPRPPEPPRAFRFRRTTWQTGNTCRVMGVVNVTPDSFSDGGRYSEPGSALAHARSLAAAGADILDIGGESTRPGAAAVTAQQETDRVLPVISAIASELSVPVSIDTQKAEVARAALEAGASIINDVSGFHRDPGMWDVAANSTAGLIVMHMRGTPATMQQFTDYTDLVGDICTYFTDILEHADQRGIDRNRFMLDPGIGFSKTVEQNCRLIARTNDFRKRTGRPVLMGPSRKSFIGKLLDISDTDRRSWGTAAAVAACVCNGADIVRVHDVAEMKQVVTIAQAIRRAR